MSSSTSMSPDPLIPKNEPRRGARFHTNPEIWPLEGQNVRCANPQKTGCRPEGQVRSPRKSGLQATQGFWMIGRAPYLGKVAAVNHFSVGMCYQLLQLINSFIAVQIIYVKGGAQKMTHNYADLELPRHQLALVVCSAHIHALWRFPLFSHRNTRRHFKTNNVALIP